MDRIIIACRRDALGERMLAFLNAMYLSEKLNLKFYFLWNTIQISNEDKRLNFPYVEDKEYFFSSKFIEQYYYNKEIQCPFFSIWWNNPKEIINNIKDKKYCCSESDSLFDFQGNFIFYDVDGVDKTEYKKIISEKWKEIDFTDHILTAIKYANVVLSQDYVAFHIRSADIIVQKNGIDMYLCNTKGLTIYLAIDLIIKCLKQHNVVILGDDYKLNHKIKEIAIKETNFSNIYIAEDFTKVNNFDRTQRMFFDITLMSNSKKLYLSGSSGFSNLAYLIGNCDKVCVYDIYSTHQKYSIIKNNLKVFDFDKYQKSFAYIHLYIYAKELKLSLSEQLFNLKEAMITRDDAFVFKLFYVDLLLQNGQFDIAEKFFITIIDNMDKFFENLLYNGWGGAEYFLYDFVFLNYLQIKNIEKYPNLYCITYYLIFRLLKVNYIKIKDKIMFFLINNYFDRKLILECSFLKNQNEIIDFLEKEIVSSLNNHLMQTKSNKTCLLHNHLAYKLGFAYKYYSKGINKIALPFILFYIKKEHQRKKIVLEQNCSNDLETAYIYQLGKIIIKAHKTWYKGGYIKLWFEIRKLKREFKKGK